MNPIFRVIDTETCGFEGGIVEIASVDVGVNAHPSYGIDRPMQDYVKPDRPIEFGAMAIHHITEDMVADALHIQDVWPMYWLGSVDGGNDVPDPTFFVAHNAAFDKGVLPPSDVDWICTLKLARYVYPTLDSHTNQYLRYALGPNDNILRALPDDLHAHRALYDVYCTAAIFIHLAEKLDWSADLMLEITKAPSLIHFVKWGKYAKQKPTYDEIAKSDPGYFQWALANMSDLDEDRRHTMIHWLQHHGHPLTKQHGRFR